MSSKPVVLAIETSGRIGSVALGIGDKIVGETSFSGVMKHSAEIFPAIKGLLDTSGIKPEQIEHLYISNGPGSFTGLRIASTMAKTMYLATNLKIAAVDTLDVLSYNVIDLLKENASGSLREKADVPKIERVAAILDAKRGQFFVAVYNVIENGNEVHLDKEGADALMTASEFIEKFTPSKKAIWLLGEGLLYHKQEFQVEGIKYLDNRYWSPNAGKVFIIGRQMAQKQQFVDPVGLKPFYLCRPDIRPKKL